jgi:hypothetical protein
MIQEEIVKVLKSDDDLTRLNEEARRQGTEDKDENAMQQMRGEVAKLLQMQGIEVGGMTDAGTGTKQGGERHSKSRHSRPKPEPIPVKEPPTYIRMVWDEDDPITFYPGERRYIRLETDANSTYHSKDPLRSRINVICPLGLESKGSTDLTGGRVRFIIEAAKDAVIGTAGELRVELTRTGMTTLSDSKTTEVVTKPEPKSAGESLRIPQFDLIAVDGPEDPKWSSLGWDDDINKTASEAEMSNGILNVYYSSVFPRFASTVEKLQIRNETVAQSFVSRYKVWLAAHSLLMYREQTENSSNAEIDQNKDDDAERSERRRIAVLASLMASKEVRLELESEGEAD